MRQLSPSYCGLGRLVGDVLDALCVLLSGL